MHLNSPLPLPFVGLSLPCVSPARTVMIAIWFPGLLASFLMGQISVSHLNAHLCQCRTACNWISRRPLSQLLELIYYREKNWKLARDIMTQLLIFDANLCRFHLDVDNYAVIYFFSLSLFLSFCFVLFEITVSAADHSHWIDETMIDLIEWLETDTNISCQFMQIRLWYR